jgi:hypothetical protein
MGDGREEGKTREYRLRYTRQVSMLLSWNVLRGDCVRGRLKLKFFVLNANPSHYSTSGNPSHSLTRYSIFTQKSQSQSQSHIPQDHIIFFRKKPPIFL